MTRRNSNGGSTDGSCWIGSVSLALVLQGRAEQLRRSCAGEIGPQPGRGAGTLATRDRQRCVDGRASQSFDPGAGFDLARYPQLRFRSSLTDETTNRAWSDTLNIARVQNLSAYDAAYLELSMRRAMPLATLDGKLRTAASTAGVPLYLEP